MREFRSQVMVRPRVAAHIVELEFVSISIPEKVPSVGAHIVALSGHTHGCGFRSSVVRVTDQFDTFINLATFKLGP